MVGKEMEGLEQEMFWRLLGREKEKCRSNSGKAQDRPINMDTAPGQLKQHPTTGWGEGGCLEFLIQGSFSVSRKTPWKAVSRKSREQPSIHTGRKKGEGKRKGRQGEKAGGRKKEKGGRKERREARRKGAIQGSPGRKVNIQTCFRW